MKVETQHQFTKSPNYSITVWRRKEKKVDNIKLKFVNFTLQEEPKKKKYLKKFGDITTEDILMVLHLSQFQACKVLSCSLSSLKRRFYEVKKGLGLERWPQYFEEIRHLPVFSRIYPMSLTFILNHDMNINK